MKKIIILSHLQMRANNQQRNKFLSERPADSTPRQRNRNRSVQRRPQAQRNPQTSQRPRPQSTIRRFQPSKSSQASRKPQRARRNQSLRRQVNKKRSFDLRATLSRARTDNQSQMPEPTPPANMRPTPVHQNNHSYASQQKHEKCAANHEIRQSQREEICVLEPTYITVPLFVCCRKVSSAVNTGAGITKIGKDIANIAVANGFVQRNKVFVYGGKSKRVKVVNIPCGASLNRLKTIECVVDITVPPMGVILGLHALKILNYKLTIDQEPTSHHGSSREEVLNVHRLERQPEHLEEPIIEEEVIMSLTNAELREMESWHTN